jgi:hypothetical protein
MLYFTGHVAGGIPSGIGKEHVEERNHEGRTAHELPIAGGRQKAYFLSPGHQSHGDQSADQHDLREGHDQLESSGGPHGDEVRSGQQGHESRREEFFSHGPAQMEGGGDMGREQQGSGSHRGGKSGGQRNPAAHESHARVVQSGQQRVFAARARHGGAQFSVIDGSAEGEDAAHEPEQDDGKSGRQPSDLIAQRSEDPGPNHVACHKRHSAREGGSTGWIHPHGLAARGPATQ